MIITRNFRPTKTPRTPQNNNQTDRQTDDSIPQTPPTCLHTRGRPRWPT